MRDHREGRAGGGSSTGSGAYGAPGKRTLTDGLRPVRPGSELRAAATRLEREVSKEVDEAQRELEGLEQIEEQTDAQKARKTELLATLERAKSDLSLIRDPQSNLAEMNKMLVRRRGAVGGRHSQTTPSPWETSTDELALTRTTTDETSWAPTSDVAATQTRRRTETFDPSGFGWGDDEGLELEDAEGNAASTEKGTHHKLGPGGWERSDTREREESKDGTTFRESEESGLAAGAGGFSTTKKRTTAVDDHEITDESSTGVTRGDGKIGVNTSTTRTEGQVDADGKLIKGTATTTQGAAHVTANKDGFGAGGSAGVTRENAHSKNLKSKLSATCDGHVIVSITPYEGDSDGLEGRFVVTVSVRMSGTAGGELEGRKGNVELGGGVTASGSIGMSFQHVMSQEECDDYLKQLGALHPGDAGNGRYPELAQIAAAWKNGWSQDGAAAMANAARAAALDSPEAARAMPEGDAVEWEVEGNVAATGKLGATYAGFSGEIEGGATKGGKLKFNIAKVSGKIAITVHVEETGGWNAGGGGGALGMTARGAHARSSTSGKGATFTLDPDRTEGFSAKQTRILAARSEADLDALIGQYGHLMTETEELISDTIENTASLDLAGVVGVEAGESATVARHVTSDAEGNQTTSDSGANTQSGKVSVGSFGIGDASTEGITTTIDAEGNLSGDLSETNTETSLRKSAMEWHDRWNQSGVVGLVTGTNTTPEPVDETEQHGKLLGDADYDKLMARAEDQAGWNGQIEDQLGYGAKARSHRPDWVALGAAIRAAKGDRAKIAEALAKYVGQTGAGREELLGSMVRDKGSAEGGVAYQFPDGLGDLKSEFKALVFEDPMAKVHALEEQGLVDEAEAEVQAKLDALSSLYAALYSAEHRFTDKAAFGEMLRRITQRKAELNRCLGKGDEEVARDRFNDLLTNCGRYKDAETNVFNELIEVFKSHTVENALRRNAIEEQLQALYLQWDPQYAEMSELADTWGFDRKYLVKYRPDRARLERARNAGELPDPASVMIPEKTDDELHDEALREREREEFTQALFQRSSASVEAQAASGARRAEAERIAAAKARKAEVAAARNQAALAAGWHNGAKKHGRPVAPAAEKKAGDGWTRFALAGKEEQTLDMVAASPMGTAAGVEVAAGKAIQLYREAEALFREGKALQAEA